MKYCELIIYTIGNALSFIVKESQINFADACAEAFADGTLQVETKDNSILVVSGINAVAIEIKELQSTAIQYPPKKTC